VKINVKTYWLWTPLILAIIFGGLLTVYLWPENLPENEGQKIHDAVIPYDAIIIFNPGGWGNATLQQSKDFAPVLEGMRQTLNNLGYHPTVIAYARTTSGVSGKISAIKEYINNFKNISQVQAKDIEYLSRSLPGKRFLLVGFSNGGGLTTKTISRVPDQIRIDSINAGVPFWHATYSSTATLALNNEGRDTLATGDAKEIAATIVEAPFRWLWAKIKRENLSLALALEFPGHVYQWSSPEVGPPIMRFLETNFKK
jgi:pimeloyl-ACP methyl ester carboxylesterase